MKRLVGINYEEAGDADTTVVCMHGIGGDSTSFEPQLKDLSKDYRIISWNMPGYGGSEDLVSLSFKSLAEKLLEFLEALGIERANLCGQSVGGMIAMETASLRPDRIATLALIGTTSAFGGRDDSFKQQFVAARLKPLNEGHSIQELAVRFAPEIVGPIASRETIESATRSLAAVPEKSYRDIIHCLVTFNRRNDIANFNFPCCLIAGDHDQNAPAKTMQRMAEKIPVAEFHTIAGAGHLINLEAGKETNQILRSFYEKHQ